MIRAANCKLSIQMLRGFGIFALFSFFLTTTASATRLELNMHARFEYDTSCVYFSSISLKEDGYVHWLFTRHSYFRCDDAVITFAKRRLMQWL